MRSETSHLTALRDHNVLHWLAFWVRDSPCVLDLCDNVHPLDDIAEDDVLAIEMGCSMLCSDDEELAAICLYSSGLLSSCCLRKLTLGPLLAIDNSPGLSCFNVKFSSANFSVP